MIVPGCNCDWQLARSQQRLPLWLTPAQGLDGELAGAGVEFAPHQAVGPVFVHRHRGFQNRNGSPVSGAAQEHNVRLADFARQGAGQGRTQGSRLDPGGVTFAVGLDELTGVLLERGQPGVPPTVPDLGLPEVIEAFDFCLKARFPWWREDWNESQAQTKMDDATQATGQSVRALKANIIVKL